MRARFRKMHGLGNDFVIFDERQTPLPLTAARIAALSDRRRGIGCDQVIRLTQAEGADLFMHIHNADGTTAGACGNATRCVAALLATETGRSDFAIATVNGTLKADVRPNGTIDVNMGQPKWSWQDIPLSHEADTLHLPLAAGALQNPAACSMGNPHATFFTGNAERIDLATIGPMLEHDPLFPDRANIGVATITGPGHIRLRVWERGAGLTLACGSGACAALVNAARRDLCAREATVTLDGGTLHIAWQPDGVHMAGTATSVFDGIIDLAEFGWEVKI